MNKMYALIEKQPRPSFFREFENDRMTSVELFGTLGGIEHDDELCDLTVKDVSYDRMVFDRIIPCPEPEPFDSLLSGKKFKDLPKKNYYFFSLRVFRTLLQYICIKVS